MVLDLIFPNDDQVIDPCRVDCSINEEQCNASDNRSDCDHLNCMPEAWEF